MMSLKNERVILQNTALSNVLSLNSDDLNSKKSKTFMQNLGKLTRAFPLSVNKA